MQWVQDYLGGFALLLAGAVIAWVKSISGRVNEHETRLTVAETQAGATTRLLEGIRDELKGMRSDAKDNQRELYAHIDRFRVEMKSDLSQKQDKRA